MSKARDNEWAVCDFTNKKDRINEYISYMINRINHMFEYDGLPDNISRRSMEQQLMTHGCLCICKIEDDEILNPKDAAALKGGVYTLWATPGGITDLNNEPTFMIVSHPRLKQSKQLKINEDCVLLRNDCLSIGLVPMFERYATLLVENDITINMAEIQSRMTAIMASGDDATKASAELFLNDIKNGKMGVILDDGIDELFKLQVLPYSANSAHTITDLIELEQYIKASWFNEMGLSANYNMKREAINSSEAQLGQDGLIPLVDDMLHSRQEAWDKANELFGTNVKVDYHRPWFQTMEALEEPVINDGDGITVQDEDPNKETPTEETEETTESDDAAQEKIDNKKREATRSANLNS